jgi:UDPglucose--hexose-1-phosphate uridylyltransferase
VFDNDFPALFDYELANEELKSEECFNEIESDLFKIKPAKGACKVMCFHPFSDLTLPTMKQEDIVQVIHTWIQMFKELKQKYEWVQIFENKGDIMGCSNPHPHCQVWASDFLPNDIKVKHRTQKEFFQKHKKNMLVEYLQRELGLKTRVVLENEHWAVLVPFWAVWPYETILLPKRQILRFDDINDEEIACLADAMKRLLIKYDNLFKCSFPYSMGFHFAPSGSYLNEDCSHWQFHAEYLPPLLRSATVKKFMVGYELMAQAQRDLTAEMAAKTLRELSDTIHYTQTS